MTSTAPYHRRQHANRRYKKGESVGDYTIIGLSTEGYYAYKGSLEQYERKRNARYTILTESQLARHAAVDKKRPVYQNYCVGDTKIHASNSSLQFFDIPEEIGGLILFPIIHYSARFKTTTQVKSVTAQHLRLFHMTGEIIAKRVHPYQPGTKIYHLSLHTLATVVGKHSLLMDKIKYAQRESNVMRHDLVPLDDSYIFWQCQNCDAFCYYPHDLRPDSCPCNHANYAPMLNVAPPAAPPPPNNNDDDDPEKSALHDIRADIPDNPLPLLAGGAGGGSNNSLPAHDSQSTPPPVTDSQSTPPPVTNSHSNPPPVYGGIEGGYRILYGNATANRLAQSNIKPHPGSKATPLGIIKKRIAALPKYHIGQQVCIDGSPATIVSLSLSGVDIITNDGKISSHPYTEIQPIDSPPPVYDSQSTPPPVYDSQSTPPPVYGGTEGGQPLAIMEAGQGGTANPIIANAIQKAIEAGAEYDREIPLRPIPHPNTITITQ